MLHIPSETLGQVLAYVRETDQAERAFLRRQVDELQRERAKLQNRLDILMDLLLDGTIDRQDFEIQKVRLRNQQADLETHIAANREGDDGFKNTLISLVSLSSQSLDLFTVSTIEQKRKLLNFVFANLSLNGRTLCYSLRKPFDLFLNLAKAEEWRPLVDSMRTNPDMRTLIIATMPSDVIYHNLALTSQQ